MRGTVRRNSPSLPALRVRSVWRVSFPLLAIALVGSVALSACGGGSSSAASSTTSSTSAATSASSSSKASSAAFAACMQKHGVKFSGFGTGATGGSFPTGGSSPTGGSFNSPAFQKASAACASLRPKGFGTRTGGFSSAASAAYRNCLKLHGVTLPSGSSGAANSTTSTTLNTKNASVQKALAACASLRPKGFGTGAGGFSSAALSAYRNCLKLHGVTLPSGSSGAANSTTSTTLNTKSASVQKALAACASLLPRSTPPSSTTSTSTTS